jgi:dihydroorotate dehydrogenase
VYKALIWFLFLLTKDPETVHRLALIFLNLLGKSWLAPLVRSVVSVDDASLAQTVFGVTFKNPVGLAAGLDKNGVAILGLEALGFGFTEMGTVTRHAQPGNARQRIFRLPKDKALINRMGFNNVGADAFAKNLNALKHSVPLGINLGKSKITELKDAAEDYLYSFRVLYEFGDYFVVNVSSPNTPGLRELQDKKPLLTILSALNKFRDQQAVKKPILVKISPDMTNEAIDDVLAVIRAERVDGIVATNTTVGREHLYTDIKEDGGLSGRPLINRVTEIIRYIHKQNPKLLIIGVGGIFTAEDAYEKIKAGASLVQVYTGFIYEGPLMVKAINRGLVRLLEKDGYKNITEAVGKE